MTGARRGERGGTGTTVAAFDVGTNSVLLLVARLAGERLLRVHERCTITRLGQDVAARGTLRAEAVQRTLAALEAMASELADHGVRRVGAVGTAALRRVSNGADFTGPAEALLGCPIEVISGAREAALMLGGVVGAFGPQPAGTVVFDVGGGSTELVLLGRGRDDGTLELRSLELGAVRLSEGRLDGAAAPSAAGIAAARREAASLLSRLPSTFAVSPISAPLIGVAGTVTTLATVELGLAEYDTERVNGLYLSRAAIAAQIERFASVDLATRRTIVGLEEARADVILGGALIVEALLTHLDSDGLRVCDRGLRWGLARELARGADAGA